jgi:hypothetical protein
VLTLERNCVTLFHVRGPSNGYRQTVFDRLKRLENVQEGVRVVTPRLETQLDEILSDIYGEISNAVERSRIPKSGRMGRATADQTLTAVDEWASVASYAVSWLYAPQSPSPEKMAGWARAISDKLRTIVNALLTALAAAAKSLGALSWSIGLGFPWGISVAVTWN